jgi:hypothetical protein
MAIDAGTIAVAGIMAIGNFGGIALLAKKYASSVDEHNKSIPAMLESLKTISETQAKTAEHLDELYDGRNELVKRVTVVETVHRLRGCNDPFQGESNQKHGS